MLFNKPINIPPTICNAIKANIGEISKTPPIGGIIPLKMFNTGSVIFAKKQKGCCHQFIDGNHVKRHLINNNKLYNARKDANACDIILTSLIRVN